MDTAAAGLGTLAALMGTAIIILIGVIGHYSSEPCPQCQARGRLRWRHACKDGTPDLRYRDNAKVCGACGWADDDPTPQDPLVL